jgi:Tfp pilus assembly protein FimV
MSATITVEPTTTRQPCPRRRHAPTRLMRPQVARTQPSRTQLSRPALSEATYRRRRAVVGIVLAVLVAAGAVLTHDVLAGSGGVPASAAASQPARARTTVTARPGDSLWSIAERHHGEVALSRYVDALVDLNGGAAIQAGQAVLLP